MWFIRLNKKAKKELEKLDKPTQLRIIAFLESKIAPASDPKILGKALKGKIFGSFVRFRIGDYRLICDEVTPMSQTKNDSKRETFFANY